MIKFITIWIALQLLFTGAIIADINNRMIKETYDCPDDFNVEFMSTIIVPMTSFIPVATDLKNYCNYTK